MHTTQHSNHQHPTHIKKRPRSQEDWSPYESMMRKIYKGEGQEESLHKTQKKVAAFVQIYEESQLQAENPPKRQHFYAHQISSVPLRQKFAALIPEHQSAQYSLEQRILIRIQSKLDEHLLYLKLHRNKKKGEFFKSIRKNLIESFHLIMELSHLKQILFIDPQLYTISREKDRDDSYDVLIDLPNNSDQQLRKQSFKFKLYHYLKTHSHKRPKTISIPLLTLPFEERILRENKEYNIKKCEYQLLQQQKKQEKYTLLNVFSKGFQFQKKLQQKIQAKSKKAKEKEVFYQNKRFGKDQMLRVIDQVHFIYSGKRVCNIFWTSLIQLLSKKLLIADNIVEQIVGMVLEMSDSYLKRVEHHKGLIIQMDTKLYPTMRKNIIDKHFL